MKVAIINQPMDLLLPPYQNSIGLWTFHVSPHMAVSAEVIVFGKRHVLQQSWNGFRNVEFCFLPAIFPNRKVLDPLDGIFRKVGREMLPIYASRAYYLDYIVQVAREMRRRKVDLAHVHNFTQFVPVIRSIYPQIKIALHMNCEWLNQLDYGVMKERIGQSDLIFGSSDYIVDKAVERYPEFTSRCHSLYNGVDVALFHPADSSQGKDEAVQRLLFVGRVSPEKGVHDLLEAFALIAGLFPNLVLDVAGPIGSLPIDFIVGVSEDPRVAGLAKYYEQEYSLTLQQIIEKNNLRDRVNFLGAMPQPDLVRHYQMADILINPSYSESFGMSLVEALACKTPVIATRIGGMVNIVNEGETGLLVDCGDVSGLAEAIRGLLENKTERIQMGEKGRQEVIDRFSWSQIGRKALEKYALVV